MKRTKVVLLVILAIIIVVFTYKIYAPYTIQSFNAVNLKNIKNIRSNISKNKFSFVVLGNIENSISIFDKQILKELQENPPDFIISTGNNVVDSGEGKYRVLYRTLQKMKIPFVTAVGENEIKDDGFKNFYKYFGPFYFSFPVQDSYFIFLDTTDHSTDSWQHDWLEKELEIAQDYKYRFVVMNKPPLQIQTEDYFLDDEEKFIQSEEEREYYQDIFSRYQVTSVFSSNLEIYHQEKVKGVNYIISGGAGGELILESDNSFYNYIKVDVNPTVVQYNLTKLDYSPGFFVKIMVNIWVALQSFLYTNYLNLIIIALIIFMAGFLFYKELNREVDYYPDFINAEKIKKDKKLRIAMFTNNYFPVIGGVPISIERLARGLRRLGHQVYIFAPTYKGIEEDEQDIIRCKYLYYFKNEGMDMPITNIFSKEIERRFKELEIDLVHCHHPFWLGSKGLSLGEKYNLPVVFTYHTRLEKYSHYLPGFLFVRKLFENRISHLMIKGFANRCNAIFAPTESTMKYLRNVGVKRHIEVLPTGVDLDNYHYQVEEGEELKRKYIESEGLLLITVSRLSKEKNLYFLLDGLALVKNMTNKQFKAIIIGDGPEREDLELYVEKQGLEDYVQLIGAVDYSQVCKYYLAADLFVFASTSETQGMVVLEAMAGCTPVVAVRSSGIDDIIEDGVNGYKTGEDIDKWAEKIVRLMEDPILLEKMKGNAEQEAREHSLEKMARRAEEVYQNLEAGN